MSVLIKNGRIITATDDYIADIFIEGETIKAIGKNLAIKADKEIDASGKLVFPGGIDPHVHLDMPFMGTDMATLDWMDDPYFHLLQNLPVRVA